MSSSSLEATASEAAPDSPPQPRRVESSAVSLIQIMDTMEDQVSKLDSALDSLSDESTRADLTALFDRVKGLMLLFQQKAITEITSQDRSLKESRLREAQWKDLSQLFSEYD